MIMSVHMLMHMDEVLGRWLLVTLLFLLWLGLVLWHGWRVLLHF